RSNQRDDVRGDHEPNSLAATSFADARSVTVRSTMEILRSIPELERLRGPLFLAIGVFDGVHRGHQAVISTSAEHARAAKGTPVVVTFDPHPEKVLRPEAAP